MLGLSLTTAFLASALISGVIALYTWRRRHSPASSELGWLMLAASFWSLTYALEWTASDLRGKIFWSTVSYLGSQTCSVFYFLLALRYSQQDTWLTHKRSVLFFVFPLISLVVAITNSWHHLLWPQITLQETANGIIATYSHGPWFWLEIFYAYVLLGWGIAVLIRSMIRFPQLYSIQSRFLVLASLAPLAGNGIYALYPTSLAGIDPTPIAFTLTGVLLGWAIFRHQLLNIYPIARERLMEEMSDGIIVLDVGQRVVDINPAAQRMLGFAQGLSHRSLIGLPITQVMPEWPQLAEKCKANAAMPVEFFVDGVYPCYLEVTASRLQNQRHKPIGCSIVLHDITQRREAEQTLHARERFLTMVNAITNAALQASDTPALLQILADRMGALIYADGCYITLWDEKTQTTIPMAASGTLRDTYPHSVTPAPHDITMTQSVLQAGHALVAEDVFDTPYISPNIAARFSTRSMLGLPLLAGARRLGAILVAYNTPHIFSPEEIFVEEQAAAQVALAIDKILLLEELRQTHQEMIAHTKKLEKLTAQLYTAADVSRYASSLLDLDQLLQQVVHLAGERFELYYMGLFLVDDTNQWAVLQAATGQVGQKMLAQGYRLKIGSHSIIGWCIANGQAHIAQDVEIDRIRFANPFLPDTHSEMGLPLISRGQVIGAITIQSQLANAFNDEDIAVFQTMADQLANAISNARLYEQVQQELSEKKLIEKELQRRAQEMAALYDTSIDINAQLDLPRLLHAIVERATAFSGAHMGGLYLLQPDGQTLELVISYQLPKDYTGTVIQRGEGLSGRVAQTGESLMIADYMQWEGRASVYANIGVRRVLGVPLKTKGQVMGVINIADTQVSGPYTDEQIRLVSLFADQAAIAVENARLFGELQQANLLLEELATTDKLTGAYNRRKFDDVLVYEIRKAQRYQLPLALLMFDIDHFKQVNDTYGHQAGDQTLVELVKLVRENIRGSDWLTRWGGEEFVILASGINQEQSALLAEKIRMLVDAYLFTSVEHITISLGVVQYQPDDTPESMLRRVDAALYIAKNSGRNYFAVG
jgi:diguanylate cyclase (GGDEF)-like protein/PAS domain S-box-containing protein